MATFQIALQITGQTRQDFRLSHTQTIETDDPLAFVSQLKALLDAYAPAAEPED